jgi:ornithine decarboxylase
MKTYASIEDFIIRARPEAPHYCLELEQVSQCLRGLIAGFAGEVAYAVKCNPHPLVLEEVIRNGGQAWDVASIEEVRLVSRLSRVLPARFMHPVKPPADIVEAYTHYGVTDFAVDQEEEVRKFVRLGIPPTTVTLLVRLAVSGHGALANMAGKFGVGGEEAVRLLRLAHSLGFQCGITFHVGSQCLDPMEYQKTLAQAITIAECAGVPIRVLDVGGGFPARYEGDEPPFSVYVDSILKTLSGSLLEGIALRCEPGRSVVAGAVTVLTRVDAIKSGERLVHLNDGIYGGLSEINFLDCVFPVKVWDDLGQERVGSTSPWRVTGPTCDSSDMFKKAYSLPNGIAVGDYVGFGMLGAYSPSLATRFNGYGAQDWVQIVKGAPS